MLQKQTHCTIQSQPLNRDIHDAFFLNDDSMSRMARYLRIQYLLVVDQDLRVTIMVMGYC